MTSRLQRSAYIVNTIIKYGYNLLIGRKRQAQTVLFERLLHLGGIYVKFLQLLTIRGEALQVSFFGQKNNMAIFDQVNFEKIDIHSLMRQELGMKAGYIHINDAEPFAAGSFAQVYSGTLYEKQIVIKVLRPSVTRFLPFDLTMLGFVARAISLLQPDNMLDFKSIYNEFRLTTLKEIDYIREANSAKRMKKQFEGHPTIFIPQTFSDFSTSHIIAQERVFGLALTDLLSADIDDKPAFVLSELNTELNSVMEELAYGLLAGSLSRDGSHGDPHPGNIYILSDNRVALIDFGIEACAHDQQKQLMPLLAQYVELYNGTFKPAEFSEAMLGYFMPELTHCMQTLSTYYGKHDLARRVLSEIGASVDQTIQKKSGDPAVTSLIGQHRMLSLFTKVINKNNRFGVRTTIDAPAFLRSTQIFLNLVNRLGCDKQLLRRTFERVLAEQGQPELAQGPAYDNESVDRSLHIIAGWLDRLQYSDPSLHNRLVLAWRAT